MRTTPILNVLFHFLIRDGWTAAEADFEVWNFQRNVGLEEFLDMTEQEAVRAVVTMPRIGATRRLTRDDKRTLVEMIGNAYNHATFIGAD